MVFVPTQRVKTINLIAKTHAQSSMQQKLKTEHYRKWDFITDLDCLSSCVLPL